MNYPVWYIPSIGGAILIAIIAIVHVIVSHFAVGGGLWLVLTEQKAHREKKPYILEFVKHHTLFFMLLTMVFGAMTGVGIWITISLISPDATSVLVHSFLFAWAIEWVFFAIEIVTAFLYYYTFNKVSRKTHLLIGWIYFFSAWASLFVINAILSFMISPGKWLETQRFWDGILNPTFLSSSIFRTFLALALAGSYALLTATKKFRGDQRKTLVKYNGKWILFSVAGMIPSLIWYYLSLPAAVKSGFSSPTTLTKNSLILLVASLILFIILLIILTIWKAHRLRFSSTLLILSMVFIFFGAFEFLRESGRKPYVIHNYMYSNGIRVSQLKEMQNQSFLKKAKWVKQDETAIQDMGKAGEDLFRIQCASCHTLGFKNNILATVKNWNQERIMNIIGRLKGITPLMPPFIGTDMEKEALARWLFNQSHREISADDHKDPPVQISGEHVFNTYCLDCHDSPRDIMPTISQKKNLNQMLRLLERLEEISEDMPPFSGDDREKNSLAKFLMKTINSGKNDE